MPSNSTSSSDNVVTISGIFFPAFLAFALLAILFPIPQPSVHVNQPFKVELLLALFLIAFLAGTRTLLSASPLAAKPQPAFTPGEASGIGGNSVRVLITFSIVSFILWSAVSALWGASFGSVAHHTLLWSAYLIFFARLTDSDFRTNTRFISSTFVLVSLVLGFLCVLDYVSIADFVSAEGDLRIRYGKYAELLATISPVVWVLAVYARGRRQIALMSLAAVAGWITVMLSLSKGAFLAGIIGFVVFFLGSLLFSSKVFRKRVMAFAALWLAITIGTQVFFSWFSAVPSTTSYITGTADTTRTTTAMRLFTWKVGRQMTFDHWFVGVGADNFGLAFNDARKRFRATHPNEMPDEIAEDYLVERAHNEPLQVLSELGGVGILLFALPFVIFALFFLKAFRKTWRLSPVLWASAGGMLAFAVSSQFSSFSFRAAQNGVAFFMVFALAVNEIAKRSRARGASPQTTTFSRLLSGFSWCAISLLLVFCAVKAYAQYHAYAGERSADHAAARAHFESAIAADPGYAGAYFLYAARVANDDPPHASRLVRNAINNGLASAPIYSRLAKLQIDAGDIAGTEATYREAVAIFARSIFLRTELQVFLEDQQKSEAAAEQAAITRSINERQANGWYMIIREGSVAAFYRSKTDPNIAAPVELTPQSAVRQYLDKIPGM